MHILFLTQVIPYPPDAGPKIKTWNVIRWLVESGCQVTLVSFARPQEAAAVQELRGMGIEVIAVPLRRRRLYEPWSGLVSILRGRPFLVERDDRKAFRAAVAGLISAQPVDVIHADQVSMAQFAVAVRGSQSDRPALVFDAHNAVWVILARAAQNAAWFWKPFLSFEARRMKRYEGMLVRSFDRTLAVSDTDRRSLEEAAGVGNIESRRPITVVPIGVDTRALSPVQRQPGSLKILTLGTLRYPPNAEGIRWFIREVYPRVKARVPGASLAVLGAHPPADFQTLAARHPEDYQVPGYVPD
ncbi:MAG TPA: glycosyltransferase, partial [Anaerolineaceae bacterium]